jgi:hypothetical protein
MKVVKYYRNALSKQVGEAIRIQRRGLTLNSKGEYNRCHITRLTLGDEELDIDKGETVIEDNVDRLLEHRDRRDKLDRANLGRPGKTRGNKRKEADVETGRRKRRKFDLVEDSWGLDQDGTSSREPVLMSGFEGLVRGDGLNQVDNRGVVVDTVKGWQRPMDKPDKLEGRNQREDNAQKETDDIENPVKEPLGKIDKKASKKNELNVKKKVWTRLDNGLFAWRVRRTGTRTTKACPSSDTCETTSSCSSTPRSSAVTKNSNLATIEVPKIFINLEERESFETLHTATGTENQNNLIDSAQSEKEDGWDNRVGRKPENFKFLRVHGRSPGMK